MVLRGIHAVYPELQGIRCLVRRSTSSDIYSVADGQPRKNSYGLRVYFQTDTPEALKPYFASRKDRFEVLGCGCMDLNVFGQSNRLDYIGSPALDDSLRQDPRPCEFAGGEQPIFTVAIGWLPVVDAPKAVAVTKPLAELLGNAGDQNEVIAATAAGLDSLLEKVGRAPAGSRHEGLVKLAHLMWGLVASGCLLMDEDRLVAWVTGVLQAHPNWDDKPNIEVEARDAIRSGRETGALAPTWLYSVARQYAGTLIASGVSARDLGVRFIFDEGPRHWPQEGPGVHRFDQGYMTLPKTTQAAITAALAAGRQVTCISLTRNKSVRN